MVPYWAALDLQERLTPSLALEGIQRAVTRGMSPTSVRWRYQGDHADVLVMMADDRQASLLVQKTLWVVSGLPGTVALYSAQGNPLVFCDGAVFTGIRTAAIAAYAVSRLGHGRQRQALLGAGFEAYFHARALASLGGLEELRIWNRTKSKAHDLESRLRRDSIFRGISLHVCGTVDEAVRGVDVVTTVTASPKPILHQSEDGMLVLAMGSWQPNQRELAGPVLDNAHIVVDCPAAWDEAGEFVLARKEGYRIPEPSLLWDPALSSAMGRTTVVKSVGAAIYDLAVATMLLEC